MSFTYFFLCTSLTFPYSFSLISSFSFGHLLDYSSVWFYYVLGSRTSSNCPLRRYICNTLRRPVASFSRNQHSVPCDNFFLQSCFFALISAVILILKIFCVIVFPHPFEIYHPWICKSLSAVSRYSLALFVSLQKNSSTFFNLELFFSLFCTHSRSLLLFTLFPCPPLPFPFLLSFARPSSCSLPLLYLCSSLLSPNALE